MRKLIAKTIAGKEYIHSRSNAYFVDKHADQICEALNKAEYQLREGERWHVYDYDCSQTAYVDQVISLTRTGKIRLSRI